MKTQINLCPFCKAENSFEDREYSDELLINGKEKEIRGFQHAHCRNCGEEPLFPIHIAKNQILLADAEREDRNLLISDEIKDIRDVLGLSQEEASIHFGVEADAFLKYERGEIIQSEAMDKLLRSIRRSTNKLTFPQNRKARNGRADPFDYVSKET